MARGEGVIKHIHKYYYLEDSNVWRCGIGGCTHFLPLNLGPDAVVGRASLCWNCHNRFILTQQSIKSHKPICADCATIEIATELADTPWRAAGVDLGEYLEMKEKRAKKLAEFRKLFPNIQIPDDADPDEYIRKLQNPDK